MSLTGLAYTLTPQIDRLVHGHGHELTVTGDSENPRPLSAQITAARAAHPGGTIATIRPGEGDATTQSTSTCPDLRTTGSTRSTSARTRPR